VATALELYCTGSLNLFNHPTNVKTDSRVVCIVLKNMGENLRKIAMHITNEFVSQAVDQNFHEGAATWCYFDEFHILLRDPLTASYFVAVWKMLRKKGCVPSALHAERQRPFGQPGNREHSGQHGFYDSAFAGAE